MTTACSTAAPTTDDTALHAVIELDHHKPGRHNARFDQYAPRERLVPWVTAVGKTLVDPGNFACGQGCAHPRLGCWASETCPIPRLDQAIGRRSPGTNSDHAHRRPGSLIAAPCDRTCAALGFRLASAGRPPDPWRDGSARALRRWERARRRENPIG